jgi:hypothetical protein
MVNRNAEFHYILQRFFGALIKNVFISAENSRLITYIFDDWHKTYAVPQIFVGKLIIWR